MDERLESRMDQYAEALGALGDKPFFRIAKVQSTAMMAHALEQVINDLDADPVPRLQECLDAQLAFLGTLGDYAPDLAPQDGDVDGRTPLERTCELFQNAWTVYSDATYDHSVTLVEERFAASGVTPDMIAGKRCFDGGCGSGRLSLALAKLGASEVVSMDFGQDLLVFFQKQLDRHGVSTVSTVQGDVTDLSRFGDGEFDFVASYGVLHHTSDPLGGLAEHMRVLREGGTMWLYLYGEGGLYWECYDRMRPVISSIDPGEVKNILCALGLREGFVYSYLDNVLAPRTYHRISDITKLLSQQWEIEVREADGPTVWDSPSRTATSPYGAKIVGPEGEVRLVITKKGAK